MLTISKKAITELKKYSKDIRISIAAGGCSGLSYKLDFETNKPLTDDKVIDVTDFKIIVDDKSFLYLNEVRLDFSDGLQGTGFTFTNNLAKRVCGCGSSFSL